MGVITIIKHRQLVFLSAILPICIGTMVVCGWFTGSGLLKSIAPRFVSMKFNTALSFIFLGAALLLHIKSGSKKIKFIAVLLALVPLFTGFFSFIEVFGYHFKIDEFFIKDTAAIIRDEKNPGRMSPLTAVCFLFSGLALLFIKSDKKPYIAACQILLHGVTLIAIVAFFGYLLGVPNLYSYSFPNAMALHTTLVFIFFSMGASLINPQYGITSLFIGNLIGHVVARQILAWTIPTVLALGYIRILLYRHNILDIELGIVLVSVAFLLISMASVWKTSQKLNKIEQKEKLFEENFRMGIEAAPYALILSNEQGYIIHANYYAEKTFKYAREELIGAECKIILPDEILDTLAEQHRDFYENPKVISYRLEDDMHCHRKDGSRFPAEIVISPVITSEGPMALTSVIDLTLRVENERMLQENLQELQHKNEEMEQFNYIASHDLQEPLRTVTNYIMLLQEDYPDNITPEISEHLDVMDQAAKRMSRLIRTLLDFGRLGRDKKLELTDCSLLVKEVTADLGTLIKSAHATITIEDGLPILYAYDTELRQLFQNLINNAIKFKKPNTQPFVTISCREIKGFYEISVADNGIGISEKHFNTIFHIFQRVNRNEEYEGYGIGLANCKKIVEMHGGRIWVESEYGKGSTFKFTLINFKP